jgi:hypothetical protein
MISSKLSPLVLKNSASNKFGKYRESTPVAASGSASDMTVLQRGCGPVECGD